MDSPNRPLEFRAYHSPTQCLFEVAFFTQARVIGLDLLTTYPRTECVLMQFTGLYDCAGKKVFEGDVLYSYYPGEANFRPVSTEYWRVIGYRAGGFCELASIDADVNEMECEMLSNYSAAHDGRFLEDRIVDCYYLRPDLLDLNTAEALVPASFM